MPTLVNVTHHLVDKDATLAHCYNQANIRLLKNGDLVTIYNEERFPYHHDTGQAVLIRSRDGGLTWDSATRRVVMPYTDLTGNWDCGIAELTDGTLIVNFTLCAFFKRGIRPESVSWSADPMTAQWGDWTWAYRLRNWIGTYVIKSTDDGATWSAPIPVNVLPLKHAGTRLGCWPQPDGTLLMGVYGRIRGYNEDGEGETTRSALLRSDDNGDNWEYYSTLAYDPASIIDYEEPALLRLADGRLVCFLRTHVNPSGDAKNLALIISDDDGFSWTPPKWTNIWGYPAELLQLRDGRYLMVYGYRRPPYGVRGILSEDGVTWDKQNEFVIRLGGVPGQNAAEAPGSTMIDPVSGRKRQGAVDWNNPGLFQHIGYPSATQLPDGTIVCVYHEWSDDPQPLQYVLCTRFQIGD